MVVAVLFFLLAACQRGSTRFAPGSPAPVEGVTTDLQGKTIDLNTFRGKVVLLNFWATWCAPCVEEMPGLERLYRSFSSDGLEVVAIASDDGIKSVRNFVAKNRISFSVLFDAHGTMRRRYDISGYPESFLIDKSGKFVMVPDPIRREPVIRIVGPRKWDSPAMKRIIAGLM